MRRPTLPSSPQRSGWRWAAAGGVLGLAVALVAFAPARWLASRVDQATQGRLLLQDARGTVWTGSAQLVLSGGQGSTEAAALPSRLHWQLRPRLAGAHLSLAADCCLGAPLQLDWRQAWQGGTLQVADGRSLWPAALLAGLGTPWNTLELDGDLAVTTQGLSLRWTQGRLSMDGTAELQAQRMASRLSTLRPLGSYRITLAGGALPGLQLATIEGDLRLSGSGQWVGSRLRFAGEASATPEREAALSNLLNIIGRRNGARSIITIG